MKNDFQAPLHLKDPIVGFVMGQKGLMYNLSFAGTKFTKLDKK